MNIGLVVGSDPHLGGGFQAELATVRMCLEHGGLEHRFLCYSFSTETVEAFARYNIPVVRINRPGFDRILERSRRWVRECSGGSFFRNAPSILERQAQSDGMDLLYFVSASSLALDILNLPFMFTVWDLCHREWVEFPEVSAAGEFERREHLFHRVLPRAVAVFAESVRGKENLGHLFGVSPQRVHVLPPYSSIVEAADARIEIDSQWFASKGIAEPFVFYPAQFWPHKNHRLILDALAILKRQNSRIQAVFCGSDRGNQNEVRRMARGSGVEDLVIFAGFVSDQQLLWCYRKALALIMPSYFGPTNLPPLEAFAHGCPVIAADLPGIRDQIGGRGLLVDVKNPQALAEAIQKISDDAELVAQLRKAGKSFAAEHTQERRWQVTKAAFESYRTVARCWRADF